MSYIDALILGLIQGLAEFFPISSSGHLKLAENIMELKPQIFYDILLHLATLVAVVYFYRKEVVSLVVSFLNGLPKIAAAGRGAFWREDANFRFACYIIAGSFPTAIIGYAGKKLFANAFDDPQNGVLYVAFSLIGTTLVVGSTYFIKSDGGAKLNVWRALIVGSAQGLSAAFRGLSRSGSTMTACLWMGVKREEAARFSFILSIPAILGAAAAHLKEIDSVSASQIGPMAVGFAVATATAFFSLVFLTAIIKKGRLYIFAPYTLLAAAAAIAFWASR